MDGCFKIKMAKIREYQGPIDKFTGDELGYLILVNCKTPSPGGRELEGEDFYTRLSG